LSHKIGFCGLCAVLPLVLSGCARIVFYEKPHENALNYYDPQAYLAVTLTKDCTYTASPLVLPGTLRSAEFRSGYGSANLTLAVTNGLISSVGQNTDTQIPATISALSSAVGSLAHLAPLGLDNRATPAPCPPSLTLYKITNGSLDMPPALHVAQ
jgi:uncharacterized protein YceK